MVTMDELYHHGILGQRWGVRRTPEQLGRRGKSRAVPGKQRVSKSDQFRRRRGVEKSMNKLSKISPEDRLYTGEPFFENPSVHAGTRYLQKRLDLAKSETRKKIDEYYDKEQEVLRLEDEHWSKSNVRVDKYKTREGLEKAIDVTQKRLEAKKAYNDACKAARKAYDEAVKTSDAEAASIFGEKHYKSKIPNRRTSLLEYEYSRVYLDAVAGVAARERKIRQGTSHVYRRS